MISLVCLFLVGFLLGCAFSIHPVTRPSGHPNEKFMGLIVFAVLFAVIGVLMRP